MPTPKVKHEWRKHEKSLYLPKTTPEIVNVPSFPFLTIRGAGNPNEPFFKEYISALYPLAYGIKMMGKKKEHAPVGYFEYTVYPLEGVWSINEEAQKNFTGKINKDDLVFQLMIRQPDFVTESYFEKIVALVKKRKPYPLIDAVKLERIEEGRCIQMLHIGPFDDEPASFQKMEAFATQQGVKRLSKIHREIYLSDFRITAPEKLKTVLRFQISD